MRPNPLPWWLSLLALVLGTSAAAAQGPFGVAALGPAPAPKVLRLPPAYDANEPMAEAYTAAKSAEYLDIVARDWMGPNSCGHCHANFTYVLARPLLKEAAGDALAETRRFLEARVARFEKPRSWNDGYGNHNFYFYTEVVSTAATLALDDAQTTGKLHAATRSALDRMWALQTASGWWEIEGCAKSLVPPELDTYYTAALAAIAAGAAPENYARTPAAQDGLTRLRRFLHKSPPTDLHDRALVLWASLYVDGILTRAERDVVIKDLLAKQRADGGWSVASLAPTRRHHPRNTVAPKDPPSDGYATGFTVYVLRQAGVSASDARLGRAVHWLQSNQRASGRWFAPSSSVGQPTEGGVGTRDLSILNAGTAFAILALKSCE